MFCRKGVLKIFCKIQRKTPVPKSSNKVADFSLCSTGVFLRIFRNFENKIFIEHLQATTSAADTQTDKKSKQNRNCYCRSLSKPDVVRPKTNKILLNDGKYRKYNSNALRSYKQNMVFTSLLKAVQVAMGLLI